MGIGEISTIDLQRLMGDLRLIFASNTDFTSISVQCLLIGIVDQLIEKQILAKRGFFLGRSASSTNLRIEIRKK